MKKAKKRAHILLALGIFSIISAVAGTPLLAWVTLKGWYIATVLLSVVVAHGFYGIPFYLSARKRASYDIRCMDAISRLPGAGITELAREAGLTDKAAAARISKCVARGYVSTKTVGDKTVYVCNDQ